MGSSSPLKISSAIVMLLAIGLAAAMWSDSLKIKTTIDTGSVDVRFGDISTDDPPGHIDPGYDKNVATCTAELVEVEDEEQGYSNGDNDLDLNVTIENGYPSYTCTVNFTIINSGTIPVKLIEWFILPVIPPGNPNQTSILPLDINLSGIWVGYQLDPGQSVNATLKVHVNQSASENTTYRFQIKFKFAQWNEQITTTTTPTPMPGLSISKYFSNSTGGQLTVDIEGVTNVSIVINQQGKATSTNPGHVVEIIAIKNSGNIPLTGTLYIEINISTDWNMSPPWSGSPSGNVHICFYPSTPPGFPYYPAWPFGNPYCQNSGGTLITNSPGITYSVTSTGSFPGYNQKLVITIPTSILPGGSFNPGNLIAVAVKTEFVGIGSTIPNGYFDKSNAMGSYKEFIDKARASIGSLEVTTQGVFRGYPK